MGRTNLWKQSWNGGELSPRMDARTDQIKYAAGAKTLENFIPTVQGPIIRRGGTVFIAPTKNSADRSWLIEFRKNIIDSYILEFGDKIIRFYTNRGFVSDKSVSITGINNALPAVFTSVAHGLSNGQMVQLSGIAGAMGKFLNVQFGIVINTTVDTFSLTDIFGYQIDSSTLPAYTSGGTASRVYQIASPYAAADLTDSGGRLRLRYFQSQDVIYITHPSYPMQTLSRLGNTNWTVANSAIVNGPFQTKNSDVSKTVYLQRTTPTISDAVNNGAGLIRLTVSDTSGIVTGNSIEVYNVAGTTEANGVWAVTVIDGTHLDLISSVFTNAYSGSGNIIGKEGTSVNIIANNDIFTNVGSDELFYVESPITTNLQQWAPGVSISQGTRNQQGLNTYIALNTATTGGNTPTHIAGARFDGPTGVNWLYEDSGWGVIKLNQITTNSNAVGTIQVPPPVINSNSSPQSSLWAHGQFGSKQGYPEVVTVFRDRLTLFKGIQCMGSVSDDYLNFAPKVGGQQTADSGYVITLPIADQVMWAISQNDLLVGTQSEEIIVTEINPSSALGPTNIRTRPQTKHGSVSVQAVPVEFVTMFINKSGQQLRQMVYNWGVSGYTAPDMTMFGEHIPKGPDGMQGISQMDWAADPDTILWGCTTDGRLVGFTYHSEQQVTAWHPHPLGGSDSAAPLASKGFTNATIECVRVIPSPTGFCDDLWLQVKRTINGQEMRYIEYLTLYYTDVPANLKNAFYVDAGLSYNGVKTSKVYGLNHLIGQTVDILGDGGPQAQKIVASDGSVTLQIAASTIQIGLPCPARFVSLRPEGGTQIGTAQTLQKRITKIAIRLLDSLGIKYGDPTSTEPFVKIPFRKVSDPMDTAVPLFTGDKGIPGDSDLDFPAGTNGDGYIEILCDQPLPCTIVGARATMDVIES